MKTSKALTIIQSVPPYTQHVLYYGSKFGSFKLFLSSVSWQNRKKTRRGVRRAAGFFLCVRVNLQWTACPCLCWSWTLVRKLEELGKKNKQTDKAQGQHDSNPLIIHVGGGGLQFLFTVSIGIYRRHRRYLKLFYLFILLDDAWKVCVCVCVSKPKINKSLNRLCEEFGKSSSLCCTAVFYV